MYALSLRFSKPVSGRRPAARTEIPREAASLLEQLRTLESQAINLERERQALAAQIQETVSLFDGVLSAAGFYSSAESFNFAPEFWAVLEQ